MKKTSQCFPAKPTRMESRFCNTVLIALDSIDDRSIVGRWVRFAIIDLYGNSHGTSNGHSKRELPRNEWLLNGLPKKLLHNQLVQRVA